MCLTLLSSTGGVWVTGGGAEGLDVSPGGLEAQEKTHLSVLEPVPALVFVELLKGIGQERHHSTVQIPGDAHNVRKRLASISDLDQTQGR